MKSLKLSCFIVLILYNCGTGPWYMQKRLYNVYKDPVYNNSKTSIRTDGYYAKESDITSNQEPKNIIIFNNKGYTTSMRYESLQDLISTKSPIKAKLDWWTIKNDSLIIEHFGENKRLIKSTVWWYKGSVLNDSVIEITYEDDTNKHKPIRYRFIKNSNMPEMENTARYCKKSWYVSNLNKTRK